MPLCCGVVSLWVFMVFFLFVSWLAFYVLSLGNRFGEEEELMVIGENYVVPNR